MLKGNGLLKEGGRREGQGKKKRGGEKEGERKRERERERFIDMLEWNHRSTEQT